MKVAGKNHGGRSYRTCQGSSAHLVNTCENTALRSIPVKVAKFPETLKEKPLTGLLSSQERGQILTTLPGILFKKENPGLPLFEGKRFEILPLKRERGSKKALRFIP
jgi:hypothetical protein